MSVTTEVQASLARPLVVPPEFAERAALIGWIEEHYHQAMENDLRLQPLARSVDRWILVSDEGLRRKKAQIEKILGG